MRLPTAQPPANTAMSREAAKSLKPSSCSQSVKKTIAFHGVLPTIPCRAGHKSIRSRFQTSPSTPASLSHADFTAALYGRQGKKRQKFSAQQPDAILCSWHCSDCMQGKWRMMSSMLKFTRLAR